MGNDCVVRQSGDEHTHLIVQQHVRLCQQTMRVDINKAQKTSEKAHERLDETNKRLARLDDDETGKVTMMWLDKQETRVMLKRAIIAGILSFIFAQLVGWAAAMWINQTATKSAVNELLIERRK